ncbi:intercellular adhesion molecule 5-like isoform X2 [Ovis aries]|nr:intercellular adhesion molecule 5-like isoform X2 [Ovis aries]
MVGSGEFQVINCTANCTDPKKLVLETALHKTLLEGQAQWKLFKVVNISENVELLCSFTCGGRQEMKVFIITVFYPPKQVLLTLWPTSVAAGTLFTIECRVPAVAPLEGLTVTLLRGTEILYNHTFVGTAPSLHDALVSHNTTAHGEDGHHNFLCEAQMDLRSHGGGVVHRVSDPQRLEVKGEAEPTDQEGVPPLSALRGRKRLCPALCQLRGGTRGNDTWSLGFPGAPGEFLAWTLTSCLVMSELGDLNQVKLLSLALTALCNDKFDWTDPEGPLESRFCDPRWSRSSVFREFGQSSLISAQGGAWPGPRHSADHEVWQRMARAPSESISPHGLTEAGCWPGPRSSFPPVITPFATHLCNAE